MTETIPTGFPLHFEGGIASHNGMTTYCIVPHTERESRGEGDCAHIRLSTPKGKVASTSPKFIFLPQHKALDQVAISFVKVIMTTLNGQEVDSPHEFHPEITEEILNLHNKHFATKVKMEINTIGPHLTLILKARGVLNMKKELEAGYKTRIALTMEEQQAPHPRLKKHKEPKKLAEMQSGIRLIPHQHTHPTKGGFEQHTTTQVYSITPQPVKTTKYQKFSEIPQRQVIFKTMEKIPPPNPLPSMIEHICQAHRRLENLLVYFTTKAPQKLVNIMNDEFFKIQREVSLHDSLGQPTNTCLDALLKSQDAQL